MMVMVVHHDGSPLLTCCFVLWIIIYEMVGVVLWLFPVVGARLFV